MRAIGAGKGTMAGPDQSLVLCFVVLSTTLSAGL